MKLSKSTQYYYNGEAVELIGYNFAGFPKIRTQNGNTRYVRICELSE